MNCSMALILVNMFLKVLKNNERKEIPWSPLKKRVSREEGGKMQYQRAKTKI